MTNLFTPAQTVQMSLFGIDGNAFSVLAEFQKNARKQGWCQQDIDKVINEAKSSDYDNLLAVILAHCDG